MDTLSGETVLVTGASRGLGRSMSLRFVLATPAELTRTLSNLAAAVG